MTPAPRAFVPTLPVPLLSMTAIRPAVSGASALLGVMPRFMRGIHGRTSRCMDAPPSRGMTGEWGDAAPHAVIGRNVPPIPSCPAHVAAVRPLPTEGRLTSPPPRPSPIVVQCTHSRDGEGVRWNEPCIPSHGEMRPVPDQEGVPRNGPCVPSPLVGEGQGGGVHTNRKPFRPSTVVADAKLSLRSHRTAAMTGVQSAKAGQPWDEPGHDGGMGRRGP
jgi:hypothetical protein